MSNCFARHCKLSLLTYPLDDKPFWSKLFGPKENIQPGAEVGKANGLTVLLDAETYDYTYHLRAGEGFKVNKQWLAEKLYFLAVYDLKWGYFE